MRVFTKTISAVTLMALLGCGDKSEPGTVVEEEAMVTARSAAPAAKVTETEKKTTPSAPVPEKKSAAPTPPKIVVPPPPKPVEPSGTPLVKGAPPFDHVSIGKLKKKQRVRPLEYVAPAKRGVFWIKTLISATDEKGKRSFGKPQIKAFFTENAVGELAMVAEGRPDPNNQSRMASMMKFVYQWTKKGKFKGDFQLVAQQALMQNSPKPLAHAQILVASKTRKYKDPNGRYTITAKPMGLQDITVHGTLHKGALRMERSWTRNMGGEVIKASEISWWAPGVGEVAKLARFGDDKGPDAVWTLTLLKDNGVTDNPHTLASHFRTLTTAEVERHNARSAAINEQLKSKSKAQSPSSEPYLMGKDARQAAAYLKRIFYLEPSGKPSVEKIKWGSLGVISVRNQFYSCPQGKGCGYGGIMLFTNAKTGQVVGGLTSVPVSSGVKRLSSTTQNFFKLIAGSDGVAGVAPRVQAELRTKKGISTVIGKGKLSVSQTTNRQSWTVGVMMP